MKARLALIAALAVTLPTVRASAQAWVSNRDFSEGPGIRAGNFELHPSIGGEFGYDTNFFRASESEGVIDVFKLRITPSLTLSTLGDQRRNTANPSDIAFAASAFAAYYEIIPTDSAESEVASRRNVSIGADMKLDVFPKRKLGLDVLAGYIRAIDTEGNTDDLAGEGFNRNTLRGGAGVTWRPGGGLFEWRNGYMATYHTFENDAYTSLANVHHQFSTRGRWRFLPRSALLFESTYTLVRYTHANTVQTDGDQVRTRVGFHGLVTYHLALLGMLGWGASFYEPHPGSIRPRQFDSWLANAEARWFMQSQQDLERTSVASGLSSIAVGYHRIFNNSYYGSFYQRDRGYLQFTMFLLGAFSGGLEFGVSRVGFPEVTTAGGVTQPAFSQLRLDGRLFGEYHFTDTLAANTTLLYDQVNSDEVQGEPLDYKRFQAWLGVRWFM
jgi:hypothetical protein